MQKIVNVKKMTLAGFSQRGSHLVTQRHLVQTSYLNSSLFVLHISPHTSRHWSISHFDSLYIPTFDLFIQNFPNSMTLCVKLHFYD